MKRPTVHYDYGGDVDAYEDYYINQSGYGLYGLPVFYGQRTQRSHGIGNIFGGLFRTVFPLIKRFAPLIGRKALQTGIQIASDVAEGRSLKEATKERVGETIREGINKLTTASQSGSGVRRKRKKSRSRSRTTSKRKRILKKKKSVKKKTLSITTKPDVFS